MGKTDTRFIAQARALASGEPQSVAYRGYLIRNYGFGRIGIQIEGQHIGYAQSIADAKRIIDEIKGPGRNPVPPSSAARIREGADLFKQFTGHDAELESAGDAARELGLPLRRGEKIPLVAFGELLAVEYETVRDGKTERYRHSFRKESRPLLAARHDGKRIFIVGGRYRFTDRGIVDA